MEDNNNIDNEKAETEQQPSEQAEATAPHKMTRHQVIAALSNAVRMGNISAKNARQIRAQYGIIEAAFTKGKTSAEKRKIRRRMQKASRRANRGITKGWKDHNGQKFRMN